jgi:hypothetical protein
VHSKDTFLIKVILRRRERYRKCQSLEQTKDDPDIGKKIHVFKNGVEGTSDKARFVATDTVKN